MIYKLCMPVLLIIFCSPSLHSQTSPVKHFSLKTEPTDVPADSLGSTYFYSIAFETAPNITLTSGTFKLKGLTTDTLINQQTFNLPAVNGIYQTGNFTNGLIKDQTSFFILLGNVKSLEPLKLVTDFTSGTVHYNTIVPNE